jgi:hypothetical protein
MPSEDRISKRLDRAWFAGADNDSVFNLLAVVSSGVPIAIGLLVDGRVIRGVLTHPDVLTDAATAAVRRPLDAFGADWEADVRESMAEAFVRQAEQRKARSAKDREVADKYLGSESLTIDDIDDADIAAFYHEVGSDPSTVIVRQAQMVVGESSATIDVMSVKRSSISAWWFLDSEDIPPVTYGPTPE